MKKNAGVKKEEPISQPLLKATLIQAPTSSFIHSSPQDNLAKELIF